MKRCALIAVALLLCAGPALAQNGHIGIFADPQGTTCDVQELFPHVIQVYVVHVGTEGALGAQFAVAASADFTGTYLGESLGQPNVGAGNSQTGVSVGYGDCLAGPVHILTLSYYVTGDSDPCSYLEIVPHPDPMSGGAVLVVDCSHSVIELSHTGRAHFNKTAQQNCDCANPVAVAVHPTTWAHVKAMYGGIATK